MANFDDFDTLEKASVFLGLKRSLLENLKGADGIIVITALANKADEFSELANAKLISDLYLENNQQSSQSQIKILKDELQHLQSTHNDTIPRIAKAENYCSKVDGLNEELKRKQNELKNQVRSQEENIEKLRSEARDSLSLISKLKEDLNQSKEQSQKVNAELKEAQNFITQKEIMIQKLKTSETTTKLANEKLGKENAILKLQIGKSKGDIEEVHEITAKERKQKNTRIIELESKLDDMTSTKLSYEETNRQLKSQLSESSLALHHSLEKLKETKDAMLVQEEGFHKEMLSSKRIYDSLANELSEEKAKTDRFKQMLEESRKEFDTMTQSLQKELDGERASSSYVKALLTEDKNADLSEDLSNWSLTEKRNKTSEMYIRCLALEKELDQKKQSHVELKQSFDELLSELEFRAPEIHEQMNELQNMQNRLQDATNELLSLMEQVRTEKHRNQELTIELRDTKARNSVLDKQRQDFAVQIQNLLMEIEIQGLPSKKLTENELILIKRLQLGPGNLNEVDNVVSENLIKFRNIHELQQQNERLTRVVRTLTLQIEQSEFKKPDRLKNEEEQALIDAQSVIVDLNKEIGHLKESLNTLPVVQNTFQRSSASSINLLGQQAESMSSKCKYLERKPQEYQSKYEDCQSRFELFRNDSLAEKKDLAQNISDLRSECANLRIECARTQSHLEFSQEKIKIYERNAKTLECELNELRKRDHDFNLIILRYENKSQELTEKLLEQQKETNTMMGDIKILESEKCLAQDALKKFHIEFDSVSEEKKNISAKINQLNDQFEDSQKRFRNEQEIHRQKLEDVMNKINEYEYKLSQQEMDLDLLRKSSQADKIYFSEKEASLRDTIQALETENIQFKKQKEDCLAEIEKLSTESTNAKIQLSTMESEIWKNAGQLENRLRLELVQKSELLEKSNKELKNARWDFEQMKSISETAENTLKSLQSQLEIQKRDHKKAHYEDTVIIEKLRCESNSLKSALKRTEECLDNNITELEETKKELDRKFRISTMETDNCREQQLQMEKTIHGLQTELSKINEAAVQSKIKYDVIQQKYNIICSDLERSNKAIGIQKEELLSLQVKFDKASAQANNFELSLKNQKIAFEEEIRDMNGKLVNYEKQKLVLLDQIEALSSLESRLNHGDDHENFSDFLNNMERNYGEILKQIKTDKEQLNNQNFVLKQELNRTIQKLEKCEKLLQEERIRYDIKYLRTSESIQTEPQNSELKDQELALLRQSYGSLQNELERYRQKCSKWEEKLSANTEQMESLIESNTALKTENFSLKSHVTATMEENREWRSKCLDVATNQNIKSEDELDQLKLVAAKFEDEIKIISEERNGLKMEVENLGRKNKEIASAWKQRHDNIVESSRARIQNLRQQLNEKKSEVESLQKRSNESVDADLSRSFEMLETEKKELSKLLIEKQKIIDNISSERQSLEEEKSESITSPTRNNETEELKLKLKVFIEREKKLKAKAISLLREKNALKLELERLKNVHENEIEQQEMNSQTKIAASDLATQEGDLSVNKITKDTSDKSIHRCDEARDYAKSDIVPMERVKEDIRNQFERHIQELEKRNAALLDILRARKSKEDNRRQELNQEKPQSLKPPFEQKIESDTETGRKPEDGAADLMNIRAAKMQLARPTVARLRREAKKGQRNNGKRSFENMKGNLIGSTSIVAEHSKRPR